MDFIGVALKKLNVSASQVGRMETSAPWQLDKGDDSLPAAYYFLRGHGEIVLPEQPCQRIAAGDLVLVPRGGAHRVGDDLAPHLLGASGVQHEFGKSDFLFAEMQGEIGAHCPFIAALPELLILPARARANYPHLDVHLQSLVWESATEGPASELLMARLWEVVFLTAFRTYLSDHVSQTTGWLCAIRDPQMARVLGAIQQGPQLPWTVERLAQEAAMSRATFIRQFERVMGEPPMKFLFLHRMGVAASLLQRGEGNLASVAARVGYRSEAAFSNAFRRHFGCAPGAYRREKRSVSIPSR